MKNFGIMILCVSLAVLAFLFALNGRYQISTYQGSGQLGGMMWMKCDTITGRVWDLNMNEGKQWAEIRNYGNVYILEEQKKDKV